MVRVALDEDHPSFAGVQAKIVDLEAHPVLSPLYSGAKVLIRRAGHHPGAVTDDLRAPAAAPPDRKFRQAIAAEHVRPVGTTPVQGSSRSTATSAGTSPAQPACGAESRIPAPAVPAAAQRHPRDGRATAGSSTTATPSLESPGSPAHASINGSGRSPSPVTRSFSPRRTPSTALHPSPAPKEPSRSSRATGLSTASRQPGPSDTGPDNRPDRPSHEPQIGRQHSA